MPIFLIQAEINQLVTKEIHLTVEADSQKIAEQESREALETYPGPVDAVGVIKIRTVKTEHWTPRDIEFKAVKIENP